MPAIDNEAESDVGGVIFGAKNCQRIYEQYMGIKISTKYLPLVFKDLGSDTFKLKIDLDALKIEFTQRDIFFKLGNCLKADGDKDIFNHSEFEKEVLPEVKIAIRSVSSGGMHERHTKSLKSKYTKYAGASFA